MSSIENSFPTRHTWQHCSYNSQDNWNFVVPFTMDLSARKTSTYLRKRAILVRHGY